MRCPVSPRPCARSGRLNLQSQRACDCRAVCMLCSSSCSVHVARDAALEFEFEWRGSVFCGIRLVCTIHWNQQSQTIHFATPCSSLQRACKQCARNALKALSQAIWRNNNRNWRQLNCAQSCSKARRKRIASASSCTLPDQRLRPIQSNSRSLRSPGVIPLPRAAGASATPSIRARSSPAR